MSAIRDNIPILVVAITFSIALFVLYRDLRTLRTRLTMLENAAKASAELYARQQQQHASASAAVDGELAQFAGDTTPDETDAEATAPPPPPPPPSSVVRRAKAAAATKSE